MPLILATQEAKIRKITGKNQPKQTVPGTLFRKYLSQKSLTE
jgi:hypothetical protein